MISLYGELTENEHKELCIDGFSIVEILRGYYGKEISISIVNIEDSDLSEKEGDDRNEV
jgi:hypothetical protein